jgi:hypothetical protein
MSVVVRVTSTVFLRWPTGNQSHPTDTQQPLTNDASHVPRDGARGMPVKIREIPTKLGTTMRECDRIPRIES